MYKQKAGLKNQEWGGLKTPIHYWSLRLSHAHLCPFSKSIFNLYESLSLTASTLFHRPASPVHRARYSTNWEGKG